MSYLFTEAPWVVLSQFCGVPACSSAGNRFGEENLAWTG
jgi:hypothetical protein